MRAYTKFNISASKDAAEGKDPVVRQIAANKTLLTTLFVSLALVFASCSPKAGQVRKDQQASVPSAIDKVEVGNIEGQSRLTIITTAPLQGNYTLLKLPDPPKVIIEMPNADPGKMSGPIDVEDGTIGRIETFSINGKGIRFEVNLTSPVDHEVKVDKNSLEISFAKPEKKEESRTVNTEDKAAEKAAEETPKAEMKEEIKASEPAVAVAPVEEKATAAVAESAKIEEKITEKTVEPKTEAPKKAEATGKTLKLKDVKINKFGKFTTAEIITDGEPIDYNVFDLKAPARVVVDIANAREIPAKKEITAKSAQVKGARIGRYDGQVRIVFDYKGEMKPYDVVKGKDRIVIFFGRKPAASKTETVKVAAKPKIEKAAKKTTRKKTKAKKEAAPSSEDAEQIVEARTPEAVKPEAAKAAVETKREERAEAAASVPVAETKAPEAVKVEAPKEVAAEAKPVEKKEAVPAKTAVAAAEVKVPAEAKPETKEAGKSYTGQKVTLEFKDADIKNIFRVIAEVSGYNMIIDNAVTGKVTLRLVNVPWDQALDLILETNSLGMTKVGNVIRVLPLSAIKKEEEDKLASAKAKEKLEDLVTKLIPVSYAVAKDISPKMKSILSDRGSSFVDERTNTIIVKDVQKNIDDAAKLIASLDTPTPQISIEARIVDVKTNYSKDLGIQWGTNYAADAAHGNPTGYYFPNSYNIQAGGGGSFSINPPAGAGTIGSAGGAKPGGSVGINFGSINNTFNLDMRLSALEHDDKVKVVSSPKIVTLDNKEASIQQGVSIPFQTTSASGTQTQFVDANLNLTVTPHVTADGRLTMKIKASKNSPNTAVVGAGGAPSINKNEATTEILVRDGDTTVIGGIYETNKSEGEDKIPFLGSLPWIGWMFKSQTKKDNKSELLIFITPRIVRPNPA